MTSIESGVATYKACCCKTSDLFMWEYVVFLIASKLVVSLPSEVFKAGNSLGMAPNGYTSPESIELIRVTMESPLHCTCDLISQVEKRTSETGPRPVRHLNGFFAVVFNRDLPRYPQAIGFIPSGTEWSSIPINIQSTRPEGVQARGARKSSTRG